MINFLKKFYRNLKDKKIYKIFMYDYSRKYPYLEHELQKIYKKNNLDKIKNINSAYKIFIKDLEADLVALKSYIAPDLLGIKDYDHEKTITRNEKIFQNSLRAYLADDKINTIPHIHHRIWLTNNKTPVEVPAKLLKNFLNGLKFFPTDWKHIFWCTDPDKIPNTLKTLKNSNTTIEVANINDLMANMPGKYLLNRFLEERHYTAATDMLKRFVVYKLGGLYCDVGIKWLKDPTEIIDKFDRLVSSVRRGPLDLTYLANGPEQEVDKFIFNIFENFASLPKEIKLKYNGHSIMKITAAQLAHYALLTQLPENKKIIMLRKDTSYFKLKGMNSWRKGTFGNNSITQSLTEW
jgi:hypothetical protein